MDRRVSTWLGVYEANTPDAKAARTRHLSLAKIARNQTIIWQSCPNAARLLGLKRYVEGIAGELLAEVSFSSVLHPICHEKFELSRSRGAGIPRVMLQGARNPLAPPVRGNTR